MAEVLLFEPDWRGHTAEWLRHVLDELEISRPRDRVAIVVSRKLLELLGDRPSRTDPSVAEFVCLRALESWACALPVLSLRAFCRWWVLRRHVRSTGSKTAFLFEFDLLTLPLAFQLGVGQAHVAGILFRPSVHYRQNRGASANWRDRMRNLRKDLLYALTLRNRAVRTVFSLDPYFAESAARRYEYGAKVKALPDPIAFEKRVVPSDGAALQPRSPSGRTTFVLFGSLTRRKGVLVLFEALARIEKEYAERIAVFVAGAVDPKIRHEVQDALNDLRTRRPEARVEVEDRYVSQEELWALIARCDVVLAPYQRFVGSSGILVWAARADKPVLTSNYGLLGRFVREYRLGLSVDTTDPSALAASMIAMVRDGPDAAGDPAGRAEFLRGRKPERFARMILAATSGEDPLRELERESGGRVASTTE